MAPVRGATSLAWLGCLSLALHAASVCGHDRALWQQAFAPVDALWPQYGRAQPPPLPRRTPMEEPSSRDLTVGLAVGVDDKADADLPIASPYWPNQPYSEIAPNGGKFRMRITPDADDGAASYQWLPLQVEPPVGPWWYQVPAATAAAGVEPYQTSRWYRPPPPPAPEEAAAAAQVVGGRPLMYVGPYGDRRVGAFRLRADRGYQLTMDIPPAAPAGSRADGVLVMEMKANLYRPVP